MLKVARRRYSPYVFRKPRESALEMPSVTFGPLYTGKGAEGCASF